MVLTIQTDEKNETEKSGLQRKAGRPRRKDDYNASCTGTKKMDSYWYLVHSLLSTQNQKQWNWKTLWRKVFAGACYSTKSQIEQAPLVAKAGAFITKSSVGKLRAAGARYINENNKNGKPTCRTLGLVVKSALPMAFALAPGSVTHSNCYSLYRQYTYCLCSSVSFLNSLLA
jgi:hypothetical protein